MAGLSRRHMGLFALLVFSVAIRSLLLSMTSSLCLNDSGKASDRPIIAAENSVKQQPETAIIVMSSLIPSHPSVRIVQDVIESVYRHIKGLPVTSPLIIGVDGLRDTASETDRIRYHQMLDNLRSNFTAATILSNNVSQGLTKNVRKVVGLIQTEFVYLLQHDLMFCADVNHTALIQTALEYPRLLRVVRFNLRKNQMRFGDRRYPCFGERSILNNVNSIHFTKTGHWSDNNQFATKSYYQELFREHFLREQELVLPMEYKMAHLSASNCSYHGPWLYGRSKVDGPYLLHLDGRGRTEAYEQTPNASIGGNF